MIDFGTSIVFIDAFTNSSGITNYRIDVSRSANQIVIIASYLGNNTYTSASLEITDIDLIPIENEGFPFEILLMAGIGGGIAIAVSGIIIIRKRSKKKNLQLIEKITAEQKSTIEVKGTTIELSKTDSVKYTQIIRPGMETPQLKEDIEKKIPEETEPKPKENMNENTTKPTSSEKKKGKKAKKTKKAKTKDTK
jgi:hypothetical protein